MTFEDDLKAAREAPIEHTDVAYTLNGTLYTARFLQLSGMEWAAEADNHPARPGVLIDARYGYNLRSLCRAIAKKTGRRVDGDPTDENVKLVELTPEQWDDLYRALPGSTVQSFDDAIWALNEAIPAREVEAAKKAFAATSGQSSDTPPAQG